MKVLMVCTGNLCRSPMAEVMLRSALEARGCSDIEVASTGTWAELGNRATGDAIRAMRERGIALGQHWSRPLDPREVEDADLVVAMTSVHRREVEAVVPNTAGKLVLMKELAEMTPAPSPDGATSSERLDGLLASERPEWRRALDLDDPMGMPFGSYERCANELEAGITALVDALCPDEPAP